MRNLPKIFLSWCVALLICRTQAQVRSARIGLAIPTPPPTTPTSRTFLSANRKFKLILEEATLAPVSDPRNVALNAAIVEEAGNNVLTLWAKTFDANPVRYYSEDDAIVSDEGDFFALMKMSGGDVSLFTKNSQKRLNTTARFSGLNAGLFLTSQERLVAADVLNGQKIIRIWLRNENLWEAFRVSDGAKISITPPIAAQWQIENFIASRLVRCRNFSRLSAYIEWAAFRGRSRGSLAWAVERTLRPYATFITNSSRNNEGRKTGIGSRNSLSATTG